MVARRTHIHKVAQPWSQPWTRRATDVSYWLGPFAQWSTWEATHNASAFTEALLLELPSNASWVSSNISKVSNRLSYRSLVLGRQHMSFRTMFSEWNIWISWAKTTGMAPNPCFSNGCVYLIEQKIMLWGQYSWNKNFTKRFLGEKKKKEKKGTNE